MPASGRARCGSPWRRSGSPGSTGPRARRSAGWTGRPSAPGCLVARSPRSSGSLGSLGSPESAVSSTMSLPARSSTRSNAETAVRNRPSSGSTPMIARVPSSCSSTSRATRRMVAAKVAAGGDGLEDLVDDASLGDVVDLHDDPLDRRITEPVGADGLEHARAAVRPAVAELHRPEHALALQQVLQGLEDEGHVVLDDELEDAAPDHVGGRHAGQLGGRSIDPGDHSE